MKTPRPESVFQRADFAYQIEFLFAEKFVGHAFQNLLDELASSVSSMYNSDTFAHMNLQMWALEVLVER